MKYITAIPRVIWALVWALTQGAAFAFVTVGLPVYLVVSSTPVEITDAPVVFVIVAAWMIGLGFETNSQGK